MIPASFNEYSRASGCIKVVVFNVFAKLASLQCLEMDFKMIQDFYTMRSSNPPLGPPSAGLSPKR